MLSQATASVSTWLSASVVMTGFVASDPILQRPGPKDTGYKQT